MNFPTSVINLVAYIILDTLHCAKAFELCRVLW